MPRGRRRRLPLLLAATGLLAACGTAPPADVPAEDVGPQRPSAVGDALQVDAGPLAQPIVLDEIPEPLRVSSVHYNENDGFTGAGAILYADPDRADTLDGPMLILGYGGGSACLPDPPQSAPSEDITVGEYDGRRVRIGEFLFIGVYGNDIVSFVLARGVPEDQVMTAALTLVPEQLDGAPGNAGDELPADAVPDGLVPVATADAGAAQAFSDAGQRLYLSSGPPGQGPDVSVIVVTADPRLAALWGAWLDDPTGTTIRDEAGSAGDVLMTTCGSPAVGRVWAEDGLVYAVEGGPGADDDLVDAVVAQLRTGTPEELAALATAVVDAPVTGVDAGCPADSAFVTAVVDDVRWVYALGVNPEYPSSGPTQCSTLITADGSSGGGIGSFSVSPAGRLAVSGGGFGGVGPTGDIVAGVAPPGTARVTVTPAGGPSTDAVLGPVVRTESGPRPGERLFGSFFPGDPTSEVTYEVVAYAADGSVLDRATRP